MHWLAFIKLTLLLFHCLLHAPIVFNDRLLLCVALFYRYLLVVLRIKSKDMEHLCAIIASVLGDVDFKPFQFYLKLKDPDSAVKQKNSEYLGCARATDIFKTEIAPERVIYTEADSESVHDISFILTGIIFWKNRDDVEEEVEELQSLHTSERRVLVVSLESEKLCLHDFIFSKKKPKGHYKYRDPETIYDQFYTKLSEIQKRRSEEVLQTRVERNDETEKLMSYFLEFEKSDKRKLAIPIENINVLQTFRNDRNQDMAILLKLREPMELEETENEGIKHGLLNFRSLMLVSNKYTGSTLVTRLLQGKKLEYLRKLLQTSENPLLEHSAKLYKNLSQTTNEICFRDVQSAVYFDSSNDEFNGDLDWSPNDGKLENGNGNIISGNDIPSNYVDADVNELSRLLLSLGTNVLEPQANEGENSDAILPDLALEDLDFDSASFEEIVDITGFKW